MLKDDESSEDWDTEEEVPPPKLQDKWFREEISFKETVACPKCEREQPKDTINCIFCDERIFEDSGLLGSFHSWFKKLSRFLFPF